MLQTPLNDIVDSDDGYCSLREAIDAASTNSYVEDCGTGDVLTDTITFDVSGMITVTSQLWVTPGGPLVIDGGGGIIISGGSNVRIFTIYYGLVITLNGLTISNGHQYAGGGIANFGFLTIINSTLLDNYAVDFGGGIENHGTLTMVNSTLSGNSSHTGGAIYNYSGTVTITNSTLTGNSANSGGGIWNGGALTIANSTLSGNNANSGGGIFNGGPLTITDSTLSGNSAINDGGGITNWSTLLTIANTTLSGNTGWDGGGIYNSEGTLTITNSTLSGNSANNDGGGIRNNGTLTITNSTLSGNNATNSGGGIYNLSWGPLTIANSIIANSLSGGNCAGDPITDAGHNIEDTDTCGFDPANGSMPDTDPLLGPLQDNGGPTLTHALLPGSPAIDAGDDDQCPTVDQRGYQRPIDGDGDGTAVCDIGSFEVQAATIPPDLITISGKEDGIVGPVVYFTATVEPISTSLPLTYTWHASDHPPITETRGLTDTVGWAWEIPGTYAITVTASNLAGSVMDTHLITITAMAPVMPESVTIIAPEEGLIGYPYDFIASVDPVSTSLPLNYTWQASGQAPVTHTSGITDQVSFTWEIPGTQLITVTASNDFNAVVDTHAILIEPIPEPLHKIYLPLINRSRQAATSSTSYLPGGGALVLLLIVGAISRWRKRI